MTGAIGEPLGTAAASSARAADLDTDHAAALCDTLATSVVPWFCGIVRTGSSRIDADARLP